MVSVSGKVGPRTTPPLGCARYLDNLLQDQALSLDDNSLSTNSGSPPAVSRDPSLRVLLLAIAHRRRSILFPMMIKKLSLRMGDTDESPQRPQGQGFPRVTRG